MTTQNTLEPRVARGAVTRAERALAPDLARGGMLLIIALAHSASVFFLAVPGAKMNPPSALDGLYNIFLFTFVHARGFPLFAIMFGYGLMQVLRRQESAGASPRQSRSVLLRRNGWLFVFGAVHGILLFDGDILGAYGIIGIAFALLIARRSDRFLAITGPGYMGFTALYVAVLAGLTIWGLSTSDGSSAPSPLAGAPAYTADNYVAATLERLPAWPIVTLTFLGLVLYTLVGAWAARRRILEEPSKHLTLLRTTAVVGLGVSIAGGLPMGLYTAGYLTVDEWTITPLRMLYEVSGTFGGIGYGAVFGLIAIRLARRSTSGTITTAITALGQRSLTGYLTQSVFWLVLGSAFLLDMPAIFAANSFVVGAVGFAVWLFTVVVAYVMHRYSYRGPAETLLRKLTYGK